MIIDTPEGMRFFQLLQFEGRLKIEIETGLSHRQPTLKIYNQVFGTNFSRKTQALEDVRERIRKAKVRRAIFQWFADHQISYDDRGLSCDERGCLCNITAEEAYESWEAGWLEISLDEDGDIDLIRSTYPDS